VVHGGYGYGIGHGYILTVAGIGWFKVNHVRYQPLQAGDASPLTARRGVAWQQGTMSAVLAGTLGNGSQREIDACRLVAP
jgi:hypothetical protein